MSKNIEVLCPCCGNKMKVDAGTGDVLAEVRPKAPAVSFEDAMGEVQKGEQRREDAFSRAFDKTRRMDLAGMADAAQLERAARLQGFELEPDALIGGAEGVGVDGRGGEVNGHGAAS